MSQPHRPTPVYTVVGQEPMKPLGLRVRDSLWRLCLTFVSVRTFRPWRYRALMAVLAILSAGIRSGSGPLQVTGMTAILAAATLAMNLFRLHIANQRNRRLENEVVVLGFMILAWGITLVLIPGF